jgi:uncharacterized protein YbjT (DUF2867 family)
VERAAQTVTFVTTERKVGAAVRTVPVEQTPAAGRVAEQHEVLSEQPHRLDRPVPHLRVDARIEFVVRKVRGDEPVLTDAMGLGTARDENAPMAPTGFAIPPRRRNALVAGATGLVGRALLESLVAERSVGAVTALVRRRVPAFSAYPGVTQLTVDFEQWPVLPEADDAYCCLGTTIRAAGSQQAFRAVDFDAVLGYAKGARAAGATRFGVVSAMGANPKSSVFYNRVKGEMEAAVATLGFDSVIIVRPSLLLGDRDAIGQPPRPAERWAARLTGPLGGLIPLSIRPIEARTVARALVHAMQRGEAGVWRFDSAALHKLGREGAETENHG